MRLSSSLFVLSLLIALLQGCQRFEGDTTVPSYLRLDSISVERQSVNAPSSSDGWYTSDINAVQLLAHFAGDSKETILGAYELPCLVPVLREGEAEYIRIVPVIKQNGIASTRIEYPYLNDTILRNVPLHATDTTCLGRYDSTAHRYYMPVTYKPSSLIGQLVYEPFEPLATNIVFDTSIRGVDWIINDAANARTGNGYLRVNTPDSVNQVLFPINNVCHVNDPSKLLYLEMDYRTDVYLRIGLYAQQLSGGSYATEYAIRLYPTKKWTKIYINLGRLWAQYNHFNTFQIVFATLNIDGTGGNTYIDNLKVITY